ncbi:hypothetical protein GBAR_LOCUS7007, partial [Geodia barretti]
MSRSVIAGLVLLLSATSVVGTGDGDDSTTDCATECVSQTELAAVKAEMESKFDKLHSQLLYWQNMTVNTVNDHCSSLGQVSESASKVAGETVLVSTVFNIT